MQEPIDSSQTHPRALRNYTDKIMNAVCWLYDHTLDYDLIEDRPKDTSKLRRKVKEERELYNKIFH